MIPVHSQSDLHWTLFKQSTASKEASRGDTENGANVRMVVHAKGHWTPCCKMQYLDSIWWLISQFNPLSLCFEYKSYENPFRLSSVFRPSTST